LTQNTFLYKQTHLDLQSGLLLKKQLMLLYIYLPKQNPDQICMPQP